MLPRVIHALIFVIILAACQKSDRGAPMESSPTISPEIQHEFSKVQAVCFGRFMVDVPEDAEVIYGRTEFDSRISYFKNQAPSIGDFVTKEVAQVEKDRYLLSNDEQDFPLYGQVVEGPVPGQRTVFGSNDQATYSMVSFVPKDSHLFVLELKNSSDKDEELALLNRIAAALRTRQSSDMPTEPGFCTEGGLIPATGKFENSAIGFRFKGFADVHFSISTRRHTQYLPHEDSLENRMTRAFEEASLSERLWLARVGYLRRGKRTLSSWTGDEVLARLPSQPGARESHQFQFVAIGKLKDSMIPGINIELVSGVKLNERGAVAPSLSDEQMIELWDRLTSTLRPRPTVAPAAPLEIKAALGTPLMTGRLCPQTGWWECNEVGVISDERRKFIKEGERMPHTIKTSQQSVWEKLVGASPLRRAPAQWDLVSYDGPDQPTTQDIPPA